MRSYRGCIFLVALIVFAVPRTAPAESGIFEGIIFDPGILRPTDSVMKIRQGEPAPDFTLPAIDGSHVTLGEFRKKERRALLCPGCLDSSCSDQWPGFTHHLFERHNAMLLGISVDNLPTLYAWTRNGDSGSRCSGFWPRASQ
jgi:peroxiredoxin (alkyl hydroperoxide reductase subunit C)